MYTANVPIRGAMSLEMILLGDSELGAFIGVRGLITFEIIRISRTLSRLY